MCNLVLITYLSHLRGGVPCVGFLCYFTGRLRAWVSFYTIGRLRELPG